MGTRSGRGPIDSRRDSAELATAADEPPRESPRETAVRAYLHRWAEAAGAQLLVVDPSPDDTGLADAMAGRGVHVTWAGSTVEGLVAFGRIDPHVVVVAADAPGLPAAQFVATLVGHGTSYVVAGAPANDADAVGALVLAGAQAVVARPYAPDRLWEVLHRAPRALDDHAHLAFGPLELDAGAYEVKVHGRRIADLPLKEFELLRTLMLRAPDVVADEEVRTALWGSVPDRPSGNTIAMHVTRLRHRLDGVAEIRRIRGRGYSLAL
jgi:DNA-binding response OmpR family regulator